MNLDDLPCEVTKGFIDSDGELILDITDEGDKK